MASGPVQVLKFGGTSVGAPHVLQRAVQILEAADRRCRPVAVVSAAAGVTDMLLEAATRAPHSREEAEHWVDRVRHRYRSLADTTLDDEKLRAEYSEIRRLHLSGLEDALTKAIPKGSAVRDAVLATGERLMTPLLAAALRCSGVRAESVDAASLLRTNAAHGSASVDWTVSRAQIRNWHAECPTEVVPVVTGFIGSTAEGVTTTLGRGGSDYSAALLAHALGADRLERWTDVDGLYTRDPVENADAEPLRRIPMEEAREWTKNGRLGLHPRTIDPLAAAGIPLHVRCTHRPGATGTHIVPVASEASP